MPLTVLKVANAKPGRHVDGRGLCLLVKPSGARAWVLRMQHNGRRRDYGLGSALDVSLAQARETAMALRRRVREGFDPVEERRKAMRTVPTFEAAARACHETLGNGWNSGHYARWLSGFEMYIFPRIGKKRVDQVDSASVVFALSPIWLKIPESARRLLQRIGVVLDFAHIKDWLPEEVSLRTVRKGLPRQTDKPGHMEAMPHVDVPAFMQKLARDAPTIGRTALRFTIYTAARSNETRKALWTDFDLDNAVWTIPAERMKMRETHVVPLSAPAVALLRSMWEQRTSDTGLIFSRTGEKPISDVTMNKVLRDDGIPSATVHGFRSSFTDWAAEMTDFPKEVADKALAHKLADKVEAAYRRTDFFEKRRRLMAQWAEYLGQPREQCASPEIRPTPLPVAA